MVQTRPCSPQVIVFFYIYFFIDTQFQFLVKYLFISSLSLLFIIRMKEQELQCCPLLPIAAIQVQLFQGKYGGFTHI